MIEESQNFLCSHSNEINNLKNDISATKNFYNLFENFTKISIENNNLNQENFSLNSTEIENLFNLNNINNFCNNNNNIQNLNKITIDLLNNKILSNNSNIINIIKTLDFCIKIRQNFINNKSEFNSIYKIYSEGSKLFYFQKLLEIDYIKELQNQISKCKKYQILAENLKKKNNKQISFIEFNKCIEEFNNIQNCKIFFNNEKEIIQNYKNNIDELNNNFNDLVKNKNQINDFKKLLNTVDKFPIKLNDLHDKLKNIINQCNIFIKELKKTNDIKILTFDKVFLLYNKIKSFSANFSEGEIFIKNFENSKENLNKLINIINENNKNNNLYDIINLKNNLSIHDLKEEEKINVFIWNKEFKELIVDNKTKPNFSILEHLIKEIKDFKITDIEKINYLKNLYSDSEKFINDIKKCNNKNDLDKIEEEIKNKSIVDLNDFIIEQSVKIKMGVLEEKEEEEEKKLLKKKRKSSNLETKSEDKISINENNENNNENNNKINNENNETYHSNKRNIKRKIDTDFEYDKDFINEFDNKIANREINNNNNNKKEENEENEEEINTSSKTKEKNNNNNNKNKININLFEKKEQKFLTKKKSNQTQEKSNEIDTLKISIKKNAIFSLENSLKENIYFNSKKDFIQSLSKTLELELSKLHPNYDENYTKTLNNMIKNIKELNKYKRVSFLVFKNKINLFKISKFPHGPKFIDKLKHIEKNSKKNFLISQTFLQV